MTKNFRRFAFQRRPQALLAPLVFFRAPSDWPRERSAFSVPEIGGRWSTLGLWPDGRWTTRMVNWIPHGGERGPGRPATRWEDSLESFAKSKGFRWQDVAKDRDAWDSWESAFVGADENGAN